MPKVHPLSAVCNNRSSPRAGDLRFAASCARWLARKLDAWAAGREPSTRNLESLRRVARALGDVVDRGAAPQQKAA